MADVLIEGFDGPREVEFVASPAITLAGQWLSVCEWPCAITVRHPDGRLIGRVPAGECRHWLFNEDGEAAEVR